MKIDEPHDNFRRRPLLGELWPPHHNGNGILQILQTTQMQILPARIYASHFKLRLMSEV